MTSRGKENFHPCLSCEIVNSEILTAEDEAARPVIKRSMFICRLIRLPGFRKDEIFNAKFSRICS